MDSKLALQCAGLGLGYGSTEIVKPFDLEVPEGSTTLVIGANGAGKSTFLRTAFGLIPPFTGSCSMLGLVPRAGVQARILLGARLLEQGELGFGSSRVTGHRETLNRLYGLNSDESLVFESPATDKRRHVGELSVGERRLEAIALLSHGSPRFLLLDEPLGGLDERQSERFISWIRECRKKGVTSVIAEHRVAGLLEVADVAVAFRAGECSFIGGADELRRNRSLLAKVVL